MTPVDEENLPHPLVPSDADLRDFKFIQLDVAALRISDIALLATADEFRSAILLMAESWHQLPAGSLPSDDAVLANLAGYGRVVSEFQKVKQGAMRGWFLCSDGRFYHPTIGDLVLEAWDRRVKFREKKEAERIRKAEQRSRHIAADVQRTNADCPPDKHRLSAGQTPMSCGCPPDKHRLSSGQTPMSGGCPAENALTVDSRQKTGEVVVPCGTTPPLVASKSQKIEFDATDGLFKNLSPAVMQRWEEAYPKLDVDAEISRAEAWYMSNPRKRKKNHEAFITNWLSRSLDRINAPPARAPSRKATAVKGAR